MAKVNHNERVKGFASFLNIQPKSIEIEDGARALFRFRRKTSTCLFNVGYFFLHLPNRVRFWLRLRLGFRIWGKIFLVSEELDNGVVIRFIIVLKRIIKERRLWCLCRLWTI